MPSPLRVEQRAGYEANHMTCQVKAMLTPGSNISYDYVHILLEDLVAV